MLLSKNDLSAIQTALDSKLEIEMTRTLQINIRTSRAPPAWLPWTMLARVEMYDGHLYSTQWCVTSEEVRQACRSGSAFASGPVRW